MNQRQIEELAGITDKAIGDYISVCATANARAALNLLFIQVKGYDPAGMALLQAAVKACKDEMAVIPQDPWKTWHGPGASPRRG